MSSWENQTKLKDQTLTFFAKGLKTLWDLSGKQKKNILIASLCIIGLCVLDIWITHYLQPLFNEIPKMIDQGVLSRHFIMIIATMLGLKIFEIAFRQFVSERRILKTLINLENDWPVMAQEKLLSLSLAYHERGNTGQKVAKIKEGCDKLIRILEHLFWGLLPKLFYLVISMIFIMMIDWRLGCLFVATFIPAMLINFRTYYKFAPIWEIWQQKHEQSMGYFCQSLINIQTVQSFVREKMEVTRFKSIRDEIRDLDVDANNRMRKYFFLIGIILNVSFLLILGLGVYLALKGEIEIGAIVFIATIGTAVIGYVWDIMWYYIEIIKNLIAVQRMKELLDEKPDVLSHTSAIVPDKFAGHLKLNNISFIYPNKLSTTLGNIELDIKPNQMIALAGRSGSGKTTLIRLISRSSDVTEGSITLDNLNITNLDRDWYRRLFAVVQQHVQIFDGTILSNIIYPHPDASAEEIDQVIKAAHLTAIVNDQNKFPLGLETEVGEQGVRLSGGEAQRVGIARAYLTLLRGTKVLILDEATSNLDSEAEIAIQEMISHLRTKQNISIIAIAHRLSTIKKADTIYVVDQGKIVEQGDHQKLMAKNGLYAQLANLQKLGEIRK